MPSPIKTPTPRSDAEEFMAETMELPCGDGPTKILQCVPARFARQLEAELAEAKLAAELATQAGVDSVTQVILHHDAMMELSRSSLAASQERVRELEKSLDRMHMLAASEGWGTPLFTTEFGEALRVARALLKSNPANT